MIWMSIHQEVITIMNMYAPNNRALKYRKQRLTELRVEIDNSTIIIRDFNALLSLLDGTTKEKINKKREDQNNNIYKLDLIDIHRTPNRSRMHIFFSSIHETFYRADYIVGYKTNLN